ncbi:MAG: PH domain-containing protein [bacterium]|nr:PH domain-containing protein [bacterium]
MTKSVKENQKAFVGQRDDEDFLFVFRKHIIAMRKGFYLLLGIFALSCLPVPIGIVTGSAGMEILYIPLAGFGVGLIFFLYHLMIWYFSIYIVTDQRIRQVTQKGFFGKTVIDIPLSKIQSINYTIPGFFADIFRFGTINILTIVGDLEIKNVEYPEEIYNRLQDVVGEIETEDYEE